MEREDRVTVEAYACLSARRTTIGGVTVLRSEEAPDSPVLNRILGLGLDEPATEAQLDAALEAIGDDVTCYVTVSPTARPAEIPDWLGARGLEPGWNWMRFRRGLDGLAPGETTLALARVDRAGADAFGRIVATGFGLPRGAVPLAADAYRCGWDCWLALDDDEPVAAAAIFVSERVGYLGLAATLPEHRGKGGQNALLAVRIEHARRAGCDLLLTETGERRDGLVSSSYRNILRAGFSESEVAANWLRPSRISRTR